VGVLLLLAYLPAQAGQERKAIPGHHLIGRSAGMTGPIAARMKPATEAMTAYFNAVNDAGGVNGRKIRLINLDDGLDPKRRSRIPRS